MSERPTLVSVVNDRKSSSKKERLDAVRARPHHLDGHVEVGEPPGDDGEGRAGRVQLVPRHPVVVEEVPDHPVGDEEVERRVEECRAQHDDVALREDHLQRVEQHGRRPEDQGDPGQGRRPANGVEGDQHEDRAHRAEHRAAQDRAADERVRDDGEQLAGEQQPRRMPSQDVEHPHAGSISTVGIVGAPPGRIPAGRPPTAVRFADRGTPPGWERAWWPRPSRSRDAGRACCWCRWSCCSQSRWCSAACWPGTPSSRRDADAAAQQRYGDVLASATAEAEAFVNLRYDDARAGVDRVAAGATGEFRERYTDAGDRVVAALERNRSVLAGEVLWAGVVDLDGDRATVIAATSGTVTSRRTEGVPLPRDFQLRLELVLEDGRWLTRDLRFVR